jgi:hypothetical protein
VPTILNSFAMFQIRECQRTICGAPNYKSRATSILNLKMRRAFGQSFTISATLVFPVILFMVSLPFPPRCL